MAFTLPSLPYDFAALEPAIDAQTMQIHHDKHHQAYINKLNEAMAKYPQLGKNSVEELLGGMESLVPPDIRAAVRNHGGGHANHALFWTVMAPGGTKAPAAVLARAIDQTFGSLAKLTEQMTANGVSQFGSGWSWLVVSAKGGSASGRKSLAAYATANQDSPLMQGDTPILGVDVWEHAYYLKYQNKRDEYLANWWKVVNWEEVARRYEQTIGQKG